MSNSFSNITSANISKESTRGQVQRRLLFDPGESVLWLELASAEPQFTKQLSAESVKGIDSTVPLEAESTAAPAALRLDPARPRPLRRRFPAADSEEARLIARAQCRELARLVCAGEHASAIRRLGADQVESLTQFIGAQHRYGLHHKSVEQERRHRTLPLSSMGEGLSQPHGQLDEIEEEILSACIDQGDLDPHYYASSFLLLLMLIQDRSMFSPSLSLVKHQPSRKSICSCLLSSPFLPGATKN